MITLKKSESIDLVCSVFRFALRDLQKSRKEELGIAGIPEIEEWADKLGQKLSPFLQSDIDLLIKQNPVTSWIMLRLCRVAGSSAEEFFQRLDSVTKAEFIFFIKAALGAGPEEVLTREMILHNLTETTSDALIEPEKEAAMVFNMLEDPSAFLSRTKKMYHDFYEEAFRDASSALSSLSEEKYQWHKARLENDASEYLDGVSRQIYSTIFENSPAPDIYYSLFFDFDVYLSTDRDPMIVIGAGADEILISRSDRVKTDILFSTLGDAKRLEMIRLISERSWYSGELAAHFKITPATMSYHLNKLVSAGFLSIRPGDQKRFYYSLNRENIRSFFRAAEHDTIGPGEES